ncbi:hypothetical protein [Spirulina sp. 06S082]|uniref:hypothetical protein n=1 Tax=Spirulina sp. 06S082 TaxID=3110248 RepID=UPI002B1F5746|nr:hypothetical protein [Spirulina sp. 06S082]
MNSYNTIVNMLVFLLHGVNTKTVQYADSLPDLIKEEFQKNNSPLPFFYSGFWGDNLKGTHAIWREIYQELHRKKTQNPNFNPDIAFRYQKFREVYFSEFLGDTFTYLNSENGKKIRNVIVQQFNDFLNTYSQEKEVHFIAHSLGTVILWDVLFSDQKSKMLCHLLQ